MSEFAEAEVTIDAVGGGKVRFARTARAPQTVQIWMSDAEMNFSFMVSISTAQLILATLTVCED